MLNFFQKMLIGYVFIVFDINIGIDILVDAIGYFLIASALTNLNMIKGASVAKILAMIIGVLSILEMPIFEGFWTSSYTTFIYFYRVGYHVLILCYYYFIFEVCTHLLKGSHHEDYTKKVKNFILFTNLLVLLSNGMVLHTQAITALFGLLVIICAFASIIVYFVYFYKMKRYAESLEKENRAVVEPGSL
jgi:hypothetical protein